MIILELGFPVRAFHSVRYWKGKIERHFWTMAFHFNEPRSGTVERLCAVMLLTERTRSDHHPLPSWRRKQSTGVCDFLSSGSPYIYFISLTQISIWGSSISANVSNSESFSNTCSCVDSDNCWDKTCACKHSQAMSSQVSQLITIKLTLAILVMEHTLIFNGIIWQSFLKGSAEIQN